MFDKKIISLYYKGVIYISFLCSKIYLPTFLLVSASESNISRVLFSLFREADVIGVPAELVFLSVRVVVAVVPLVLLISSDKLSVANVSMVSFFPSGYFGVFVVSVAFGVVVVPINLFFLSGNFVERVGPPTSLLLFFLFIDFLSVKKKVLLFFSLQNH